MVCLTTQLCFFFIEYQQLKKMGWNYFQDFWNYIDMSLFFMSIVYFIGRVSIPDQLITPNENPDMSRVYMFGWVILNSCLLLISILKMMFFLRVYEAFGMLVTLIGNVVIDMLYFISFFFCWTTIFSLMDRIAGAEVSNEEYPDVNVFVYYVIHVFRNTVGDI